MDEHLKTYRAVIRGRVQEVFFRTSLKEKADELRVVGKASNRSDGTVEVIFSSETPHAHRAFISFLHEGPRFARVDSVDIEPVEHEDFEDFEVV